MNKRTRKTRAKVRRGRRQVKMTDSIKEALQEGNAAAELSQRMKGVGPLEKMFVSVLAKVARQPGADMLMAEAVQGLVKTRLSWQDVFNTKHPGCRSFEESAEWCQERVDYPFFAWGGFVYPANAESPKDYVCRESDLK